MTITADSIRAAIAVVDADPKAGTRRTSQTIQTRRVAAALRALGLKRGQYRARVTYERDGGRHRIYGDAIGTPMTREGAALVEQHAQALADAGLRVHLVGDRSHFVASGHPGAVVDHRTEA